ncbi:aminopeptidase P family protein [Clostridium oryzae]|uniref:Xaa-Pro aminopeptidase n=1 Tax=Clostridium oryzae TaxID=1450648 RepID=A0A1V4IEH5_9CLOT|nr:aminopeptidase P family protein [Clostridium oryzae]OPJ58055.1 Xaa-Pro aminopeptidase [Clostridium oryzae]
MLSKEFHKTRREMYAKFIENNSIGVVFAGEEKDEAGDECYPFSVYRNFYYLTGYTKPNSIYMVYRINDKFNEMLFIERPEEVKERYEGKMLRPEEAKAEYGIDSVRYINELENIISWLMFTYDIKNLYVDIARLDMNMSLDAAQQFAKKVLDKYPFLSLKNTYHKIANMRSVKHREEIEAHRRACSITSDAVKHMLSHMKPGMTENQVEAYFDFVLKSNNCGHAFATIAASGPNSCVLHYSENSRKIEDGEMILFDLGASSDYYCADVSRTYPINGKFTDRQKQLYEIVLKGLEAAIAKTKPGQPKHLLQQVSKDVMAEELIKIGMIKKPEEINKYYLHGSGHFIGLYTHDVGNDEATLEEDMVFTLEPGLYFAEENIGIRIEDTILITKDGCEVLTDNIPKTVGEIEEFMQGK